MILYFGNLGKTAKRGPRLRAGAIPCRRGQPCTDDARTKRLRGDCLSLGQLNNHSYLVTAGTDREAVLAEARSETDGRGGKYSVEVWAFPADEQVAYVPSMGDAKDATGPTRAVERDAAESIGAAILLAFQHGVRSAPSGQHLAMPTGLVETLTRVPAELPPWIAELCEKELERSRRMG